MQLTLKSFDEFLEIARQEPDPLRLLLVFARKALPAGQARQFDAGEGGPLAAVAMVDKDPHHLAGHAALAEEAQQQVGEWDALFVAALPGAPGHPPTVKMIDEAGEKMVQAIRNGMISDFLLFDRQGIPMHLENKQ